MPNSSKLLFSISLIMGTILTASSENWLGIWMGLEMNMMSFIPIMFTPNIPKSAESCMIYFLIQSLGSVLLLILVLSFNSTIVQPGVSNDLINTLIMCSMMIKLGMAPFHFWFPEVIKKLSWMKSLIMMSWQKIAPMTIMSYLTPYSSIMPIIIGMSVVVGSMGGLGQTSIHGIMAFSSISHMGWMIACMKLNNTLWINYLLIYSLIITMMIYIFYKQSASYINQLVFNSTFSEKILITTLFLSLGGLPPFLGFLPKWLVIQTLVMTNTYPIMIIMIASSLINLFFYLRMISTSLLINSPTWKWSDQGMMNTKWTTTMIILNMMLPAILSFSL